MIDTTPLFAMFSAALCRGLIEARGGQAVKRAETAFSAALCRGLIEAARQGGETETERSFSAALCRGLIEAGRWCCEWRPPRGRFPRLYAAASLKLCGRT